MPRDQEDLLLLLLREGNRGDAIQLYREETGAGAEEAQEAIADLAMHYGLRRRRLLSLSLVLLLVVVIGGAVAAMAG
jgi:hypothetical protein